MTTVQHGIPRHSEARSLIAPSGRAALDGAVDSLRGRAAEWAAVPPAERVEILDRLIESFFAVSAHWVPVSLEGKGLAPDGPLAGEEWLTGPYCVLRNMRLLRESLRDVARSGAPRIRGPVWTRADGRVAAGVFPASLWDRLFFPGFTAEVWMEPGVAAPDLGRTLATAYRAEGRHGGRVTLVLGAGNIASIGPMDVLYKLFVENHVVLYKAHPVNAALGPLMEEGLQPVVERGALKVVYGGAAEGAYLCRHPGVDEIHITGSDKTYEAIAFGTGAEGERRKAERRPDLTKRITAELGNVSPVIVVPGPWSRRDLAYQGVNLASMLTNNAGFNCLAARVIVQHAAWPLRGALLDQVRKVLAQVPPRPAYYPGAQGRDAAFRAAHPEAESYGERRDGALPWTLIPGLDPRNAGDICFHTEAFCGLFGETALGAATVPEFLERAVRFCNETLWGSLNATLIVHPRTLADRASREAVERAIADLRYGAVVVNHWGGVAYGLGVTTWGAYPGHTQDDIQSGAGIVHNALMFSRAEKSVVRAPFRAWPTPPWFATNGALQALGPKLARFEARPSVLKALEIMASAVRG